MLVGITTFMIWCCIRFNRKRNPVATNIHGNVGLEIIWTVIPTILVMLMFFVGMDYNKMSRLEDAMRVKVNAWKWNWAFTYMTTEKKMIRWKVMAKRMFLVLTLPVGKPVILDMTSADVLHSFYIPAFRVKHDVLPGGRISNLWFVPNKVGIYEVFCAEYCGEKHSRMYAKVKVVPQDEFDEWYGAAPVNERASTTGFCWRKLYKANCAVCHSFRWKP